MVFQLCQHPKALGIAFEIEEVAAFGVRHSVQPTAPGGLLEPMADGIFTGMAERRVADVVGQARRLHNHAQIAGFAPLRQLFAQGFTDPHAQRATDTTDLQ
ncbi:hypothetical protein D3C79_1020460 [compost metagenome]